MQERIEDSLDELRIALAAESYDGKLVAQSVTNNPVCSVLVESAVPCLLLHWRKNASSRQFRFIMHNVIELLRTERLHKLIGDDGTLSIAPEDQDWIIREWLPRAKQSGLRAVASTIPFSYAGRIAIDRIRASAPEGMTIASFERIDDAKRWLRESPLREGV